MEAYILCYMYVHVVCMHAIIAMAERQSQENVDGTWNGMEWSDEASLVSPAGARWRKRQPSSGFVLHGSLAFSEMEAMDEGE